MRRLRSAWGAQAQDTREPLPKFLALKFHARRDKKATVTLLFPGHEAADAWVRGIKGGQHGTDRAARASEDSVQEDAACWHWLAEYLVGTRTDLDDEIVASETVNDLRKLVKAAIKQGEKQ